MRFNMCLILARLYDMYHDECNDEFCKPRVYFSSPKNTPRGLGGGNLRCIGQLHVRHWHILRTVYGIGVMNFLSFVNKTSTVFYVGEQTSR